jgi:aspartate kinase
MRTVVHKFGGTSVRDSAGRRAAAAIVASALAAGERVAVVVSAMGRRGDPYATDTLLALARAEGPAPVPARDEDLLASCGEVVSAVVFAQSLRAAGVRDVVAMTGLQAGILTDAHHGEARILRVDPEPVRRVLDRGGVPVVTGFQGVTEDFEVTTLGRGGSDTTAAALGAALEADEVAIFTDVEGIMTADPRIVPEARILSRIHYDETFELAHLGARVLHPRAVEIARQASVPLRVLSTFRPGPGTVVGPAQEGGIVDRWQRRDRAETVVGVTARLGLANVDTRANASGPVTPRQVFGRLAEAGVSVDLMNVFPDRTSFVVREGDVAETERVLASLFGGREAFTVRRGLAKVGVVGSAIHDFPGVMALFMDALAQVEVEVLATSDSHQSITALVEEGGVERALRSLHSAFRLGGEVTGSAGREGA